MLTLFRVSFSQKCIGVRVADMFDNHEITIMMEWT